LAYTANDTIGISTVLFLSTIKYSNLTLAIKYANSLKKKGKLTFVVIAMTEDDINILAKSSLANKIIRWDSNIIRGGYYHQNPLEEFQGAYNCKSPMEVVK
jgi:hypothetical protein